MTIQSPVQAVVHMANKVPEDASKESILTYPVTFCRSQWRAILAEFVSTALLMLFGCMACVPLDGFSPQPALVSPIGFGLVVLFNVQIFGHLSGAHMNPSVTLASLIWGQTSIVLGIAYVIVQCLGAMMGYGILVALAPVDVVEDGVCVTAPHVRINEVQALGIEIGLTAILSFLCCAVWDPASKHEADSSAIKFGLAITGLSIAGGPMTGASMNPARSLAPALWSGRWAAQWVYWIGPLLGSGVAATIYKFIWLKKTL